MQAARITLPSVPCTSPAFEYRDHLRTNLAETFAKAASGLQRRPRLRKQRPSPSASAPP